MHAQPLTGHYATPVKLFQWIALSLFFHVVLVTFVGGAREVPAHPPLLVDLRYIPPGEESPITARDILPEMVVETTLPQAPAPEPAPQIAAPQAAKPAVDLPVPFNSYLTANEVDVWAEPANDVPLLYPPAAYMRRIEGKVRLTLYIGERGQLDRVHLVEAAPKGIFEQAALETAAQLRFYPALKNGRPVKSQKTIEVVFDPYEDFSKPKPSPPNSSATEK